MMTLSYTTYLLKRWNYNFFHDLIIGNMFDWGAQVVSDMLEKNKSFGLTEALECIQKRPWVIDHLDDWLDRMRQPLETQNYKCCAIFADK